MKITKKKKVIILQLKEIYNLAAFNMIALWKGRLVKRILADKTKKLVSRMILVVVKKR